MSAQVDVLGAIDALVWIADQEGQESEADAGRQARADVAALIAEREQRAREYQHVLDMLGVATHEEAGAEIGRLHAAPQQPAPVVDDARMARALEWVRDDTRRMCSVAARTHLPAIEEAIAAYNPNCGARTVRGVDDELPGMWSQSDFMGGAADAADDARQLVPSVDDAMVDRYLAAQAKAVQEIDDAWGNGGKAASYLHPVREACRAGLTAALTAALARAQGVQS